MIFWIGFFCVLYAVAETGNRWFALAFAFASLVVLGGALRREARARP